MSTTCVKCGKAPADVNLNKTDDGWPLPDLWLCVACLAERIERRQAKEAEEEVAEHRKSGGRLN
jgi:hypothetical protein